jgi:hypothetical protein
MIFTAQDAARHRSLALTARRVLEERLAVRALVVLQQIEEIDDITHRGGTEVDQQVRAAEAWHISMAERIEAMLSIPECSEFSRLEGTEGKPIFMRGP